MFHLAMIKAVIPYMFEYDRLNYAKKLPVYYNQMLNLPIPRSEHLKNGGMSVPRGGGGYSHFFCIRRLGPSICPSPQKNIRNFKHPKKNI